MKIKEIFLWNLLWGLVYFGTNNLTLFAPHELPQLALEKNLDMNELWMIPYLSWFAYNILFCLTIKRGKREFTRLMTGLVLVHGLIFLLYPTDYPRAYDFGSLTPFSQIILNCDQPQNCFPSLHVAFVFMTLLLSKFLGLGKGLRYAFIGWGAAIMISTIFVKQHYALDVLGGIFISALYLYAYLNIMTPVGKPKNTIRE